MASPFQLVDQIHCWHILPTYFFSFGIFCSNLSASSRFTKGPDLSSLEEQLDLLKLREGPLALACVGLLERNHSVQYGGAQRASELKGSTRCWRSRLVLFRFQKDAHLVTGSTTSAAPLDRGEHSTYQPKQVSTHKYAQETNSPPFGRRGRIGPTSFGLLAGIFSRQQRSIDPATTTWLPGQTQARSFVSFFSDVGRGNDEPRGECSAEL